MTAQRSRRDIGDFLVQRRTLIQMGIDGLVWLIALLGAALIRHDFNVHRVRFTDVLIFSGIAIGLQWVTGMAASLYRGRYRFGSFEEVEAVLISALATTWVIVGLDLLRHNRSDFPVSVTVAGGIFALVAMTGVRYAWRLALERRDLSAAVEAVNVIVIGAGEGGSQAVAAMQADRFRSYRPVALLDDDPRKRNFRIKSLRVVGTRNDLPSIADKMNASVLLVAIPSADAATIRELDTLAESLGLQVKVLPPAAELLDGRIRIGDIRDLDLMDLLGRRQIETDVDAIAGYLTGKRVLVTGAGGSIGSELCRQIARYAPAELMMLDRDESALHAVELSITGRALLDDRRTVLADIRDVEHLTHVFRTRRPQVVFHAAALKHLPLLERYPGEAVKSNVWGTLSVLRVAQAFGVERFVNISTDKAANPTSVLGTSKRIAERLTAHIAQSADGIFLSVRFGNVLGSRGSVLTAWAAQIAAGGPVTVTDPNVTRYFMTVQEAVQLVIQAAAIGNPGQVLVLDMGEPVRLDEVAQRLVAAASRPVAIVYTGLRSGEKLHEELFALDERDVRPSHPQISQVQVPPLNVTEALSVDAWGDPDAVRKTLRELAASECNAAAQSIDQ
jgi:FlaA1/EpsC-like NDP-sugar epimerase